MKSKHASVLAAAQRPESSAFEECGCMMNRYLQLFVLITREALRLVLWSTLNYVSRVGTVPEGHRYGRHLPLQRWLLPHSFVDFASRSLEFEFLDPYTTSTDFLCLSEDCGEAILQYGYLHLGLAEVRGVAAAFLPTPVSARTSTATCSSLFAWCTQPLSGQ